MSCSTMGVRLSSVQLTSRPASRGDAANALRAQRYCPARFPSTPRCSSRFALDFDFAARHVVVFFSDSRNLCAVHGASRFGRMFSSGLYALQPFQRSVEIHTHTRCTALRARVQLRCAPPSVLGASRGDAAAHRPQRNCPARLMVSADRVRSCCARIFFSGARPSPPSPPRQLPCDRHVIEMPEVRTSLNRRCGGAVLFSTSGAPL